MPKISKDKTLEDNNSFNKVYEVDQSRWELYYEFENIVHIKNDEEIQRFLEVFTAEDFLALPIVFDLVNYKKIKLLEWLHKKAIPLIYQEYGGGNALHMACGAGGNLESVKFFIENNILTDINKKSTRYGDTPLTLAICYGQYDIVSYFKEKYSVNSINFTDLDVILDRVISNQNRLTGIGFLTDKKFGEC